MLTDQKLASQAEALMRFVNAPDAAAVAASMENERAEVIDASPLPYRRERARFYVDLQKKTRWVLAQLASGAAPGPINGLATDLLQHGADEISPDLAYVPLAGWFHLDERGALLFEPQALSLPLEFGITLAELLAADGAERVRIQRCPHCARFSAHRMGKGSGRGRRGAYCESCTISTPRVQAKRARDRAAKAKKTRRRER